MSKIGLIEIKKAILEDGRFRESLPQYLKPEVIKFIENPGCPSCINIIRKILRNCKPQLQAYFPDKEIINEEEEIRKLAQNHWSVINCKATELEEKLRKLPSGRKQIAIARYEDEITVVINEIDSIF